MQYAKKMVLVSPEMLSSIKDRPVSSEAVSTAKLDMEMKELLEEKNITPYEKVQKYNQILQRYLEYYNQTAKRPLSVKVMSEKNMPEDNEPKDDDQGMMMKERNQLDTMKLLANFPVSLIKKGRTLLELIQDSKGVLDWNVQGEILHEGEVINGSHVSDLVYDMLQERRGFEPRGSEQFLRGLVKINVPERLISNTSRRTKLQTLKRLEHTPPRSSRLDMTPPSVRKKSTRSPPRNRMARLKWDSYNP